MGNNFTFNDSGMCDNPEILFNDYPGYGPMGYEIFLCCDEHGNWDYGYHMSGGRIHGACGPAGKEGKFLTKEDCVNSAIAFVSKNAKLCIESPLGTNNKVEFKKQARAFLDWAESRKQISLFEKAPQNDPVTKYKNQFSQKKVMHEKFINELTAELVRTGNIRKKAVLSGKKSAATVNIDSLAEKYDFPVKFVNTVAGIGVMSSIDSDYQTIKEVITAALKKQLNKSNKKKSGGMSL